MPEQFPADLGKAGKDSEVNQPPVTVRVVKGSPYRWDAGYGPEFDDILYDKVDVVLAISGLKPGTDYSLGLAWSDDADTRVESVAWSVKNGNLNTLLAPRKLPSHGGGDAPEQIWLNLPAPAITADTLLIHVRNEGGINAVISDFRICEGHVKENGNGVARPVSEVSAEPENLRLNLYARDRSASVWILARRGFLRMHFMYRWAKLLCKNRNQP
ncbi:MAG: hypothetical protein D4R64_04415 [Porphyromonadaceae bacterium]|nr:MAG: hypothetical protein D4R64_04415 [Porphyromonadaceae bacterium]